MKADKCLLTDTQGSSYPRSNYTKLVKRNTRFSEVTLCRQPLLSYVIHWNYVEEKKKFFNLNLHFTPHLHLIIANILAIVANNIVHWIHVNKKPKINHNTTVISRMKNMRV